MRTKKRKTLNAKITSIAETIYYSEDVQCCLSEKVDSTDAYNMRKEIEKGIKEGILNFIKLTYPATKTVVKPKRTKALNVFMIFDEAVSKFPKTLKQLKEAPKL